MVSYKIDSGSNGNLMPFHIFKKVYPRSTKEQMAAMKNDIKLRTYKSGTIT